MEKNHSNQAPTCLKNALLKISINFRMDFVGVLSSSLGVHAIELNICHSTTDTLRQAKDIKKFLFALAVHVTSEKIIIHSAGDVKRRSKKKQISAMMSESVLGKRLKRLIEASENWVPWLVPSKSTRYWLDQISVKKKYIPHDLFYKSVDNKESRRKSSVVSPLDHDVDME